MICWSSICKIVACQVHGMERKLWRKCVVEIACVSYMHVCLWLRVFVCVCRLCFIVRLFLYRSTYLHWFPRKSKKQQSKSVSKNCLFFFLIVNCYLICFHPSNAKQFETIQHAGAKRSIFHFLHSPKVFLSTFLVVSKIKVSTNESSMNIWFPTSFFAF